MATRVRAVLPGARARARAGLASGPLRRELQSPGKQALLHYYSQILRDPSRPISRSSRQLGIGLFFQSLRTKRRETHRNQPLASALQFPAPPPLVGSGRSSSPSEQSYGTWALA